MARLDGVLGTGILVWFALVAVLWYHIFIVHYLSSVSASPRYIIPHIHLISAELSPFIVPCVSLFPLSQYLPIVNVSPPV